jgi:hypothetical protein
MPPKYQNWAVPRAPLQFPGALAHIQVFPVPLPMPLTVPVSRACEAAAFSPVAQAVANRSADGDIETPKEGGERVDAAGTGLEGLGIDSRAVRGRQLTNLFRTPS